MRTMVLEASLPRIVFTKALGRLSSAAFLGPTAPLRLIDMPDPPLPDNGWARVRNKLCGICGSDLHQIFLDASLDVSPVALPSHKRSYLGHEMIGEIVETRGDCAGLQLGNRVVRWGRAEDCLARGRTELCPACARGHRVLCQNASEPRPHHPVGGGYGDSFITPVSTLQVVPDTVSDEQAIFIEPIAVAVHAAWRKAVQTSEQVLVLGCGTVGFLLIQVLRNLQPDCKITAVAEFPWQADLARDYGADDAFLASDDGYAETARRTGAKLYEHPAGNRVLLGGFDLVFEVVGSPGTLHHALRWTRAGGTVVLVGVHLHRMQLDLTPVWYQEVNLIGAVGHDVGSFQGERISAYELATRWLQSGQIEVGRLLTHRFPLQAYRQALEVATRKAQYQSIKVALDLTDLAGPNVA